MKNEKSVRRQRLEDSFSRPENQRRSLEDQFFREEDMRLIAKYKTLQHMQKTKETLSAVSGITNEKVLQKLVELNVRPETVSALSIVPLAQVAWADGGLEGQERDTMLNAVSKLSKEVISFTVELFDLFLSNPPSYKLIEAWRNYMEGLRESLSAKEFKNLRNDIMANVRAVAKASGGFLWFGDKISRQEKAVILELTQFFDSLENSNP